MNVRLRKMIILIGIVLLALTMSCGGSSSDDDDDNNSSGTAEAITGDPPGGGGSGFGPAADSAVVLPASFDFTLIANATTTAPLTITETDTNPVRSVVITNTSGQTVTGTITPSQEGTAAGQVTFDRGDVVALTAHNFWGESTRDLTITVVQPITFQTGVTVSEEALPTSGGFTVSYPARTGGTNTISVSFAAPSQNAGVSLSQNTSQPMLMGPQTFDSLLNSTAAGWEQKADLSFRVLEELAEAISLSARAITDAEANQGELVSSLTAPGGIGHVSIAGDRLTPSAEGVPRNPGSRTLVWTDVNGDSVIDGGDSLQWMFSGDVGNTEGTLVNDITTGRMDMAALIMGTTPVDGQNVITSTGFQTTDGSRPAVLFTNFRQDEVDEDSAGVFTIMNGRGIIINGGFDILFNG
jgi:hypothetical protein